LAQKNNKDYISWIKKFSWRIQALQRIYSKDEISSDISGSLENNVKNLNEMVQKKNIINEEFSNGSDDTISITNQEILLNTWKMLTNRGDDQDGFKKNETLRQFYSDLYARFLNLSSVARSLFATSILRHIPALTKMITLVINEENESSEHLQKIGGIHLIWGIQEIDFNSFAIALCDSLQKTLGGEIVNQTVRDAWFDTITSMGLSMIKKGKKLDENGISCICYRRNRSGVWKQCSLFLSLSELHIYRNYKMVKIKTSVSLRNTESIDFEDNYSIQKKN